LSLRGAATQGSLQALRRSNLPAFAEQIATSRAGARSSR